MITHNYYEMKYNSGTKFQNKNNIMEQLHIIDLTFVEDKNDRIYCDERVYNGAYIILNTKSNEVSEEVCEDFDKYILKQYEILEA